MRMGITISLVQTARALVSPMLGGQIVVTAQWFEGSYYYMGKAVLFGSLGFIAGVCVARRRVWITRGDITTRKFDVRAYR